MLVNRVAWRNVHFYDSSTGKTLGGFYQQGSLTDAILIWILRSIILIIKDHWIISVRHRESGRTIVPSNNPVIPGEYDICSESERESLLV